MLTWTCDVCGLAVAPRKGAVWCDDRAAYQCLRLNRAHEARHASGGLILLSGPELLRDGEELEAAGYPVPWHVSHYRCDKERSCYWFGVERCATVDDLLGWNEHLTPRCWLSFTDWPKFMRRTAGGRGRLQKRNHSQERPVAAYQADSPEEVTS